VLVWDKYADGLVHDNSQYAFAQYATTYANGLDANGKAPTDLSGLAEAFDTNHDGKFTAADARFAEFKVWQDINQDGISEAGEVRSLADWGMTEVNLTSDGVVRTPTAGVTEAGQSTATLADGSTVLVADAGFEYHTASAEEQATHAIAMGERVFKLSSGLDLDLSAVAPKLAEVDASADAAANTVKLSLADVLGTTPTANGLHQLTLTGNANDTAALTANEWTNTGNTVANNGHTYAVYTATDSAATQLLIDQHMLVTQHG
jgi:hypothetical protein